MTRNVPIVSALHSPFEIGLRNIGPAHLQLSDSSFSISSVRKSVGVFYCCTSVFVYVFICVVLHEGLRQLSMAAVEMDLLDPEPGNNTNNTPSETRPRKRRRRTVACTQCRTRKLKCDREYPACSRCLKSGIPDRCRYEDSFVWQQPNTVTASTGSGTASTTTPPNGGVSANDRLSSSHIMLPPPSRVAVGASPRFASVLPAYPKPATTSAPLLPLASHSQQSSRSDNVSALKFKQPRSSRARFLDTVLDGPNPPASHTWRVDGGPGHAGGYQHALATPSQRLELPNKAMIRGKETRTRFNGGGIMSNLMIQACTKFTFVPA